MVYSLLKPPKFENCQALAGEEPQLDFSIFKSTIKNQGEDCVSSLVRIKKKVDGQITTEALWWGCGLMIRVNLKWLIALRTM